MTVALIDIGPLQKTVTLRGKEVAVSGISASSIFLLLQRYPEVQSVLSGGAAEAGLMQALMVTAPHAVACVIAAAVGHPDDPEYIGFAMNLTAGETAILLYPIIELTFPQGLKSFIDDLVAAADEAGSRGWAQVTRSPDMSNAASSTDIAQKMPGATPPAS